MSLNKLPSFTQRAILDYLPLHGTTTPMQLVSKKWENIIPFEGHLDLSNSGITEDELAQVIKHFRSKDIKIVSIDLSECPITDVGLELLASSDLPLQRLYLDGCPYITNEGLKHLAALPLIELNLTRCNIKDTGLKHLAAFRLLTKLDLSYTGVTDRGLEYLNSIPLTELDLTGCKRVSHFLSSFPTLFFPKVLPDNLRYPYATKFLFQLPTESTTDVEELRQRYAEKLPPLRPPSELDIMKSYVGSDVRSLLLEEALSPHLQSLPSSQLRVYSSYVDADLRSRLVEEALAPLIDPLPSIHSLIAPLHAFAKREMDADPKFAVYFNQPIPGNTDSGELSDEGTIEVYIKDRGKKIDTTVLIHELSHKACDKLGWKTNDNPHLLRATAAATADIRALKKEGWKQCDPAVKKLLAKVEKQYSPGSRTEEYLVRMPEIITLIAKQNPTRSFEWIEQHIKKDLPRLYNVYKWRFLPQLKQYTQTT